MNVHLVRLNPYDPNLGVLVPIVSKRIVEYAREHMKELDPVLVARQVMVPLWNQDPTVLVLAMVNTEGVVVGHAVGGIQSDGINSWLVITQTQADGAVGDAVRRSLDFARTWVAEEVNPVLAQAGRRLVSRLSYVTGKNEKAWEGDYGLKLERRVLGLALTNSEEGPTEVSGR